MVAFGRAAQVLFVSHDASTTGASLLLLRLEATSLPSSLREELRAAGQPIPEPTPVARTVEVITQGPAHHATLNRPNRRRRHPTTRRKLCFATHRATWRPIFAPAMPENR